MNLSKALKNENYTEILNELHLIQETKVDYTQRQILTFCNKILKSFSEAPNLRKLELSKKDLCYLVAVENIRFVESERKY
jgi:hypothetical protein